jgi:hypothetical protein
MRSKQTQADHALAQLAADRASAAFVAAGLGAMVVGAIAVGRLFGGRSSLSNTRADYMSIDALADVRPRAREFVRDDVSPPPIR